MDLDAVRAALATRFAAVTPVDEPFPHAFITDLFPAGFYRELRAMLPPDSAMTPTDPRRSSNPNAVNRHKFNFTPAEMALLDPARRAFWRDVAGWLGGRDLVDVVLPRFAAGIARRYGERPLDAEVRVEINIDRENYAISPHTDHPGKIVTMLVYLPDDAGRADLGTAIFVPKDPTFRSESTPQFPFERFDKVRTFPYVPNSCLAFLKTDNSFHGRERVMGEAVRRPMLFINILHRQAVSASAM